MKDGTAEEISLTPPNSGGAWTIEATTPQTGEPTPTPTEGVVLEISGEGGGVFPVSPSSRSRWAIDMDHAPSVALDLIAGRTPPPFESSSFTDEDAVRKWMCYRDGGACVIRVDGVLVGNPSAPLWLLNLFGLVSTGEIGQMVADADEDPSVNQIVLQINSPGGMVDGLEDLSDRILACTTPTLAYVNGLAASGGYWLAAACDEIVTRETGWLGSIGVVVVMWNPPGKYGETLEIVSTKTPRKREDVFADDPEERKRARAALQELVDDTAEVFISYVQDRRGDEVDIVEGRVLSAVRAIEAGLADRIGGIYTLSKEEPGMAKDGNSGAAAGGDQRTTPDPVAEERKRTSAILAMDGPDAVKRQLIEQGMDASAAKAILESVADSGQSKAADAALTARADDNKAPATAADQDAGGTQDGTSLAASAVKAAGAAGMLIADYGQGQAEIRNEDFQSGAALNRLPARDRNGGAK